MDDQILQKLSAEKLAALNDEQKTIFCMLDEKDQDFFAENFSVKDLPAVLVKKGEILNRNQANKARLDAIKKEISHAVETVPANQKTDDILSAVGLAVGGAAAAAVIATDNSAFWQGVKPNDLISPLRTEFDQKNTRLDVSGNQGAINATILILDSNRSNNYSNSASGSPALTINLAARDNGTEVKTSDLTSGGIVETIKEGGQKLIGLAEDAIGIFGKSQIGFSSPNDYLSAANDAIAKGASLADVAGNLKIKDRAWQVIKTTCEAIEKNYLSEMEKIKAQKEEIEKAWDNYNNCPQCGVVFDGPTCRVCGTPRPEKPALPDPRLSNSMGIVT